MIASWVIIAILSLEDFTGYGIDAYIFDFKFKNLENCSDFLENNIVKLENYIEQQEGIKPESFICLDYKNYFEVFNDTSKLASR